MASHPKYKSRESALQSPAARWLRRVCGVGHLFTFRGDRMIDGLGYSKANGHQAVNAELRGLKQWGIIDYVSERGADATITVRVLE